ncbi:MAG: nuclear transport factor 2 family protein [Hyphomonadaceae bacterium]
MNDAALCALADRLAIHDVLTRYFHAVDHGQLAELESCFTADCIAIYDGEQVAANRQDLMDFFTGKRASKVKPDFVNMKHRMHFIGNVTVTLNGETADSETYALAHLIDQPDQLRMRTRALRYFDKLRREPGGWRIAHRRHVHEWSKTEPVDALSGPPWQGYR